MEVTIDSEDLEWVLRLAWKAALQANPVEIAAFERVQEALRANPFCSNRSTAGDACGVCAGCVAEGERLRGTK